MFGKDGVQGEIKQYPYRTALPRGTILEFPRELCRDLEKALAEKAGVRPDNHVVYKVTQYGKAPVYVWCSDFVVAIATDVEEHPNGY